MYLWTEFIVKMSIVVRNLSQSHPIRIMTEVRFACAFHVDQRVIDAAFLRYRNN